MNPVILVVDDEPANRVLLEFLLGAHGYQVHTAAGADEMGLAMARARPDLILMDLQLPDVDGFTLTRRLKADPATAGIPVVAVTSYAMAGDQERARAAGCDGYIPKPIDTRALPATIASYLASVRR